MFGSTRKPAAADTSTRRGGSALVAREALLDHWTSAEWTDGCQIDELADLQPLTVITRNHFYELIVVNGREGRLRVRGGLLIPEWRDAVLAGSSLGGSFLKLRGIYVGFCMELHVGGEMLITTPVQRLTLAHPERASH